MRRLCPHSSPVMWTRERGFSSAKPGPTWKPSLFSSACFFPLTCPRTPGKNPGAGFGALCPSLSEVHSVQRPPHTEPGWSLVLIELFPARTGSYLGQHPLRAHYCVGDGEIKIQILLPKHLAHGTSDIRSYFYCKHHWNFPCTMVKPGYSAFQLRAGGRLWGPLSLHH